MVSSNRIQGENKMLAAMIQGENLMSWIREREVGVEENGLCPGYLWKTEQAGFANRLAVQYGGKIGK